LEPLKTCNKCGLVQPLSEYTTQVRCRYGVDNRCKTCAAAASRTYYTTNRESCLIASKAYAVAHPEVHLKASRRYRRIDPVRDNRQKLEWRKRNPWYVKAQAVVYSNKKRFRNGEGWFNASEWLNLLERCKFRCLSCGVRSVEISEPLQADHVIPVSKGGSNLIENIQPLCGPCNRAKRVKTIDYRTTENMQL
jgi:5-methylcytosine-specific restriction endonuclease McrA